MPYTQQLSLTSIIDLFSKAGVEKFEKDALEQVVNSVDHLTSTILSICN